MLLSTAADAISTQETALIIDCSRRRSNHSRKKHEHKCLKTLHFTIRRCEIKPSIMISHHTQHSGLKLRGQWLVCVCSFLIKGSIKPSGCTRRWKGCSAMDLGEHVICAQRI